MFLSKVPILSLLLLLPPGLADIVLHDQCWHEHVLRSVNIFSSHDRHIEYAAFVQLSISSQEKETHAPWSYPPTCTDILPSLNDRLCVYTSTTFSNGRGISLFTTPSLATQFASLPGFADPSALAKQHVNKFTNTWRATSIPNKGIGMLATKPLQFKDRVTSYTPAFLAYLEGDLSTMEREKWWRIAIEQLPDNIKNDFLSLTYVFGDERVRVQDIVKANTFQVEVGGVNHLAVFPETSRLNHACNPNAQYVIDTDLLSHTVHVTRPIAEGEEITIAYTSPLDLTPQRQAHLQSGFHFTCTCPRCTSSTTDPTLARIQTLQSHLNDWSATSLGSPALAEELLQLHRDEGLEGFMDVAYGFAALAYSAVGDEARAVEFAERAREALLMKDGRWSGNLRIWEEMVGDVGGHWSWRRRL
ncbi:hypothetical protein FB567DRAFT_544272 [Paraphoma chrysanthemicola]|uniref:SET domain-containing protein n=1 Tax=Paraphoma chrysanthemicola TaxID=798071 RepID=A0A8K0RJ91_9PLEO|nr:hypothetical protein FB567DRAFT_544272 [Paraphoma chrysanthemicola]